MSLRTLVLRGLRYHGRTNAAVVLGVAVAVAVLAGALLVGRSVRASLRALAEQRIGRTDVAVVGTHLFEDALASRLAVAGRDTAPVLSLSGVVSEPSSGRRAAPVEVWGVDERFWTFHGVPAPTLAAREALLSPALAEELAAEPGASLLLRSESAEGVPGSTLFGRRDDPGRALRLRLAGVREAALLGEFSLRPRQQATRAVFLPLATLQRSFGRADRVNLVLARGDHGPELEQDLAQAATLADLGLRLRELEPGRAWALESEDSLLADDVVAAARAAADEAGLRASASLVYLANAMRVGSRSVPYSLVAALDEGPWSAIAPGGEVAPGEPPPVLLNDWTAAELGARAGDTLELDYYLWHESGELETRQAGFRVAGVVPIEGPAADRELVPDYPGITQQEHLADWDPPFPVDLSRIRPQDEAYWQRYRTTPKALVPLAVGRSLWGHRLGATTSLRLTLGPQAADDPAARFARALTARLSPAARGLMVEEVRARALAAARGATDFGEYFVYFSFFLVVAALLLAGLFFRFGLEQRLSELGLLQAIGFGEVSVRRLFLAEAGLLAGAGAVLGMLGAVAYAWLMMLGLRTLWVGATGTRALALAVGPLELLLGAVGGVAAALAAIALTLRGLRGRSVRSLLARASGEWAVAGGSRRAALAFALALVAAALVAAGVLGALGATPAFFGAGALLMAACLLLVSARLAGERRRAAAGATDTVLKLGFRQAAAHPGRSVLAMTLVAFASFVVVSVGAFRHAGEPATGRDSESGGFALVARSVLPLHHDPGSDEGRAALGLDGLPELAGARLARFRLRPGEDASCLNLYRPERPTLVAPTAEFLREGRFSFQASLAESADERANPWLLLEGEARDGAIPVIADAGALAYVLHRKLGETWALDGGGAAGGSGVRVRIVGALRPGLLQAELVTGERHFQAAFPEQEGFRFFLIEAPEGRAAEVAAALESRLADFGFDAELAAARLAAFHRVENTYIATFQTLGGLGLLLGTLGIGAVLVRNAFEQRRELALLRAVGYRARHVRAMVLAESALLLAGGLAIGAGSALVAILPALAERGALPSLAPLALLLAAVGLVGLLVSRAAAAAVLRLPVLESLRSE